VSRRRNLWLACLVLLGAGRASAMVECAGIFGDQMVLQQGLPTPIWGRAAPDEAVVVQFQGQVESAVASVAAGWRARSPRTRRARQPGRLGQQNTIVLRNVLVGEVWLCSGQSNMAYRLELTRSAAEAVAAAGRYPIRLLSIPKEHSQLPRPDLSLAWQPATPETVTSFSAVGYYFGAALAESRKVPLG